MKKPTPGKELAFSQKISGNLLTSLLVWQNPEHGGAAAGAFSFHCSSLYPSLPLHGDFFGIAHVLLFFTLYAIGFSCHKIGLN